MKITDISFVEKYIRLTMDGYLKGWHERNGGNFSYRIKKDEVEKIEYFLNKNDEFQAIGVNVPNLANEYFMVTGSGKYMRNIALNPEDNIAIIKIDEKGENYKIVWGLKNGGKPTSELPTHLKNHSIKKELTSDKFRVIYHSHPANIIALTFVLPLTDKDFTLAMWEMMTECPVIFPRGIGVVPWMVPGGKDIAIATSEVMKKYDVAIWAHHGIFCAGEDFDSTFGLMDAIEKSAEIYIKVMSMGGKKQTIPKEGFIQLAKDFNLDINQEFLK
ncbi:MAG: Rhamnulose-1-phosphate aldolase [Alphaproteobacteria bacterium ADurb.Bin438]|nr:MAG: Rhamnulose-1-phosphate aldolase [Alphaproteobacteria bacterium ADurb.Bin438]